MSVLLFLFLLFLQILLFLFEFSLFFSGLSFCKCTMISFFFGCHVTHEFVLFQLFVFTHQPFLTNGGLPGFHHQTWIGTSTNCCGRTLTTCSTLFQSTVVVFFFFLL